MRKLACVYPWFSPFMWTASVESMLNLRHPADTEVKWFRGHGWCPAHRHMQGCKKAVEWGADYIVILGVDQVYQPDLLERLMARIDEGYEVVTAMIPARGFIGWQDMRPFQPMAWRFKYNQEIGDTKMRQYQGMEKSADLIEVVTPDPDNPMQKINFIGSGVLLFPADLLKSMKEPWFYEVFDPVTYHRLSSMDTRFVWRLQFEAYADVWLDTSIKVKHLHPFEIDESFQFRFLDWQKAGGPAEIFNYVVPGTTVPE